MSLTRFFQTTEQNVWSMDARFLRRITLITTCAQRRLFPDGRGRYLHADNNDNCPANVIYLYVMHVKDMYRVSRLRNRCIGNGTEAPNLRRSFVLHA